MRRSSFLDNALASVPDSAPEIRVILVIAYLAGVETFGVWEDGHLLIGLAGERYTQYRTDILKTYLPTVEAQS